MLNLPFPKKKRAPGGALFSKTSCPKTALCGTYDLVMMPVVNGVAKSTVSVSADS